MPKKPLFPPPQPNEGWARQIQLLRGALICPPQSGKPRQPCGVLGSDGDVPESANYRAATRFQLPVKERPEISKTLPGRHLYAGPLYAHFGHFLAESINRLWALRGSDVESILFMPRHPGLTKFDQYQLDLFKQMGVDIPVQLVSEPTEIESLIVPGQGFGLGPIARGSPEFREMLKTLASNVEPKGGKKIVLSRFRTGKNGGVFQQKFMDENLERHGYEIFHPQHHSIEEQLSRYKAATHIVGLDGSAFHLAGLVARPDQKFAVVLRRNHRAYYNIQRQLEGMGASVTIINVLLGDWVRENKPKANKDSWGQINHIKLSETLMDAGFINSLEGWEEPSDELFKRVLVDMERRMRSKLKFIPVSTPIEHSMVGML